MARRGRESGCRRRLFARRFVFEPSQAPRRGTDAGTEPPPTANPAAVPAGERRPVGTPRPPSRASPWLLLRSLSRRRAGGSALGAHPSPAGDRPAAPEGWLGPAAPHRTAAGPVLCSSPPVTASLCDSASHSTRSQSLQYRIPVPGKPSSPGAVLTPRCPPSPARGRGGASIHGPSVPSPPRRSALQARGMLHRAANPQLRGTEVHKTKVKLAFQGKKKKT